MSKVITFSRVFPSYHPRAGKETYFVEKVWKSLCPNVPDLMKRPFVDHIEAYNNLTANTPTAELVEFEDLTPKHHTIRAGHRWKVGDWFSPRVWSGKPYNSKQITFAPDIQIKKIIDFSILSGAICIGEWIMDGETEGHHETVERLAMNDGLSKSDLLQWFRYPKAFDGQILCWNGQIEY